MQLERGVVMPAVMGGDPILRHPAQIGMRLVLTHEELAPIALGSNLPRESGERPLLDDIDYEEVIALAAVANQLSAIHQDMDTRRGRRAIDEGMRAKHYVGVHPKYRESTVHRLGTWAGRYAHHLATQEAEQEQINDAAFTAFNARHLGSYRLHVASLMAIYIQPIDTRFWDKVQ